MAGTCDPCECPEMYYMDKESFQQAVVILLCTIAQGSGPVPPVVTDRYLQEDGVFFYLAEDGVSFYIQE